MRGARRVVFAAVLLLIAGSLNIIYGIEAIADNFFYFSTGFHSLFTNLHTWGWITLILGGIEVIAGLSLFAGGTFGRVIGIAAASVGAVGALLGVNNDQPFWSLGVFLLCVIVIHGLIVYGEPIEGGTPPA
jgi:hypothetical protein